MAVAPRYRSGRSVWVFLAAGRFATNSSDFGRWISLDSLVRNETYQWVTRKKRAKVFLGASAVAFAAPRWDSLVLACGSAELFMGKSYLSFGFYAIDYRLSLSFRPAQPSTHR